MRFLEFFLVLIFLLPGGVQAKMRIFTHVDSSQFPPELKQSLEFQPWEKGFLDVTRPPYNAPNDGSADATQSLQLAINHAYACNLVVFVPQGTYLLSDQLQCYMDPGPQLPNNPISSASQRKFGHIILGSEKEGKWPLIRLMDGSNVKDNTLFVFKYFDSQTGTEDASRHYLGTLRNFEIDMGDNPGVSAVYNNGAQLCALENLRIYGNFDMGISTLPGSGGYTANIEITGGRIGIYQKNFRPNPTLFNIRLINQSECGLMVLDTRGSLTMAGFEIQSPEVPSSSYRAVYIKNDSESLEIGARANLNLVDGSIEVKGSSPAIYNYRQDLVVRNVFFKSSLLIESGAYSGNPDILPGDGDQWVTLPEYIFASGIDMGSVYRDKVNLRTNNKDFISHAELKDSLPPADLLSIHSWGTLPSWEDSSMVDLVVDYGASPDDDTDDDALSIQRAINEISDPENENFGKVLFVPRGHFHLKSPVLVKSGVKMIGAGKNISVFMVSDTWLPTFPVSAIKTENSPGPGIVLSDLAIVGNHPSPAAGQENQKNITPLEICTGQSVIRDVQISLRDIKWNNNVYKEPIVQISGHGGGKMYGLCLDDGTNGLAEEGYRLLRVKGSPSPLTFYQLSVEDASTEQENEQTVHMEIDSCAEVCIFGFKYEKESELLHVSNTGSLTIIGGSGNYGLKDPDDKAIITIKNTPEVFIGNISRQIQSGEIEGKSFLADGDLFLPGDVPIALYAKQIDTLAPVPDTFYLEFIVTEDGEGLALEGADIILGTDTLLTGPDGKAGIYLEAGSYFYHVSKGNFGSVSDSLKLEQDTLLTISLLLSSDPGLGEAGTFRIFPNPAGQSVMMDVYCTENGSGELFFSDISGRKWMLTQLNFRPGINRFPIDLSDISQGLYLVSFLENRMMIFRQ